MTDKGRLEKTYQKPAYGWTCFHCGETFTTEGSAGDHFGAKPHAEPGCMIRVQYGEERGLQIALRKAEAEINRRGEEVLELLAKDRCRCCTKGYKPIPPTDSYPWWSHKNGNVVMQCYSSSLRQAYQGRFHITSPGRGTGACERDLKGE